jgi:hypothetical protein
MAEGNLRYFGKFAFTLAWAVVLLTFIAIFLIVHYVRR